MCNSANPYYAPTAGKHVSFGNGPSMRSDIEDDVSRNVTWRTDDGSDDEDLNWRRGGSSSPRWGDRDRDRDRSRSSSSSMGWQRRSSTDSYRRNLNRELSRTDSSSSLSSSYRIPRTSRPASWDSKGDSRRRDSMHDKHHRSYSSSRSRNGGLSKTWAGGRGR